MKKVLIILLILCLAIVYGKVGNMEYQELTKETPAKIIVKKMGE